MTSTPDKFPGLGRLEALANFLDSRQLDELEYDDGSVRVRLIRKRCSGSGAISSPDLVSSEPRQAEQSSSDLTNPLLLLHSPMVGTAYRRPSPDNPPFSEVGQRVEAQQTLLVIEAMKTFNEVVAQRSGTIAEFLFADGQSVEFGEPLVRFE